MHPLNAILSPNKGRKMNNGYCLLIRYATRSIASSIHHRCKTLLKQLSTITLKIIYELFTIVSLGGFR